MFGISVQTGVIFLSRANKLRQEEASIYEATRRAAIVCLRPILITGILACVRLIPAALSHGIGSNCCR